MVGWGGVLRGIRRDNNGLVVIIVFVVGVNILCFYLFM